MTGASVTESAGTRLSYEDECKQRIGDWEAELGNLARSNNGTALQTLKTAIEAQLALADLRLRVREADHAKMITWLQVGLPTAGAIVGAFIGALLKH